MTAICRFGLMVVLLFLSSVSANAWNLYKIRSPDGTVLYTERISPSGKVEEVLQEPPPDSRRMEAERRAALKRDVARADRIALQREAKLDDVDMQIREGTKLLLTAKAALAVGLEPLPGERVGMVNGHSRLTEAYWARVHELRQAVEDARERLDDAYVARNALK